MSSSLPVHDLPTVRSARVALAGYAQPLRVLIALGTLMAACLYRGEPHLVIPLFLGAIACALGETDDSWRGRLRAQVVMLTSFAAVAYAALELLDHRWLFSGALAIAAVLLTMLGAIEARYRAIGYATLILAMYAVIGISNAPPGSDMREQEPMWLLLGAAWYGSISVLSAAFFPAAPVRVQLVRLYRALADYVHLKASLFEPVRGVNVERKRLSLAWLSARVVTELNTTKESLFKRIGSRPPARRIARYRGLYLIAQDVHERASSSHDDYNALADAFFHSDLLYRAQRVLALQGDACANLARSIERDEAFVVDGGGVQALAELRGAIEHERSDDRSNAATPVRLELLASVEALARNLGQLDSQLRGASEPKAQAGRSDMGLFDRSPQSWRDAWSRVRREWTARSRLFRHAVRLAVALLVGDAIMQLVHPAQGYWIMLTTLFVLQQTYGDTVSRMSQRVAGTLLGVVAGWALKRLFPEAPLQDLIAVVAGVCFFATRTTRYLMATAFMTVMVMMCFNQLGDSNALIWPRLIDTVIGSLIAVLAVWLVLPSWQSRHFSELAGTAMRNHATYLANIVAQYREGASDDLAYRLARRNAHNADAALSAAVTDMQREPSHLHTPVEKAMRVLIQSHTLLSYLSALGAHRTRLQNVPGADATTAHTLLAAADAAVEALQQLGEQLSQGRADMPVPEGEAAARQAARSLAWLTDSKEAPERVLRTELTLLWSQVDALRHHAHEWLASMPQAASTAKH